MLSDRYRLGEELGRGAYGQVFKVSLCRCPGEGAGSSRGGSQQAARFVPAITAVTALPAQGMDLTTGDTVAIKQISLAGMSQDNLCVLLHVTACCACARAASA